MWEGIPECGFKGWPMKSRGFARLFHRLIVFPFCSPNRIGSAALVVQGIAYQEDFKDARVQNWQLDLAGSSIPHSLNAWHQIVMSGKG